MFKVGRLISKLLMDVEISGRDSLPPPNSGPLIVVGNHFSWFEAPLLYLNLPYEMHFFGAKELQRLWYMRFLFNHFNIVPVWRGQIDRTALRQALQILEQGKVFGLMPEGGIDPDLRQRIGQGELVADVAGQESRLSAALMPARPGAAYLAVKSGARILPTAFLGTEQVAGNISLRRRTPVKMIIGEPFGPLTLSPNVKGGQRQVALAQMADTIMRQIAKLMPLANRGPFI